MRSSPPLARSPLTAVLLGLVLACLAGCGRFGPIGAKAHRERTQAPTASADPSQTPVPTPTQVYPAADSLDRTDLDADADSQTMSIMLPGRALVLTVRVPTPYRHDITEDFPTHIEAAIDLTRLPDIDLDVTADVDARRGDLAAATTYQHHASRSEGFTLGPIAYRDVGGFRAGQFLLHHRHTTPSDYATYDQLSTLLIVDRALVGVYVSDLSDHFSLSRARSLTDTVVRSLKVQPVPPGS